MKSQSVTEAPRPETTTARRNRVQFMASPRRAL
jgi:hypothetical protein